MEIEIWSDIACPWCYVGKRRFEAALEDFAHKDDTVVSWRSFQLDPTLPEQYDGTELEYLASRKGMAETQVAAMFDHVKREAAGEGLEYDFDSLVVANSFTGHRLLHLAKSRGLGAAAKEALLSAHFEKGEDIGDIGTLVEIGTSIGLDADEVLQVLESDDFRAQVETDIAEARSLGISGVPFFVIDRKYGISGAQPSAVFTSAMDQAWADAHPLTMVKTPEQGDVCGPDGCD